MLLSQLSLWRVLLDFLAFSAQHGLVLLQELFQMASALFAEIRFLMPRQHCPPHRHACFFKMAKETLAAYESCIGIWSKQMGGAVPGASPCINPFPDAPPLYTQANNPQTASRWADVLTFAHRSAGKIVWRGPINKITLSWAHLKFFFWRIWLPVTTDRNSQRTDLP